MAIYHFSAKVISRAKGSSAVAAAAYRAASRLHDDRLDRAHDFTNKAGVVHSEILTPDGAPERWADRATLWNEVEVAEKRKDAQLAREVEFALPREIGQADAVGLARDFVQNEIVHRGMVADLNVHWDIGADGEARPHAHVMLAMREATPDGFGAKVRAWNQTELLEHWREAWEGHLNRRLAELDINARVDHRSLEAQGIDLEPQHKIGAAGSRREGRGEDAERAQDHREIARRNGERIIAEPSIALEAITHHQATFTRQDVSRFIHRHTDDKAQFDRALAAVWSAPDLGYLGRDGAGQERFTTREMVEVEAQLETSAADLDVRNGHRVSPAIAREAARYSEGRGLTLSAEQASALRHVTGDTDLALVVGYAGSGKSSMLAVARRAWEGEGYKVLGGALSGIAAESLETGSGINSRTLASLEHAWARGRELLTDKDILVVDEAGLVGSRQMQRVLGEARDAGAKVVLVGDPQQLQAIEAGAAFRALAERHGAVEITQVRRQRDDWQRQATRELATGRTDVALARYAEADAVHAHDEIADARTSLIAGWARDRREDSNSSQMILTYTRKDVAALNQLARAQVRGMGGLGEDLPVETVHGERMMAQGDRVMFLRNERSLGVKNGALGDLIELTKSGATVRLHDGRSVTFDFKDYADLDHGYAATVHKAQGVTVDRSYVLATEHMDSHAAYVALSRHRQSVSLHYSRQDFSSDEQLASSLGRERRKDMASDYLGFGGNRDGQTVNSDRGFGSALQAFARASGEIARARSRGREPRPELQEMLEFSRGKLEEAQPGSSREISAAFSIDPTLREVAARGATGRAVRGIENLQREMRRPPERERIRGREQERERQR
ncbi:Ti-type conjugative transfer relaxase TraA [Phenylobacterium sp.]|uniref:Ti-type conjugative transfer relaxase TraA n=1 Tax=Phenylobacterium sp. TaxID=1871053 RepID=UPI0030F46925